ncbi:MAG: hypothetical protein ACYDCL_18530 [Myxococcales bacterium]
MKRRAAAAFALLGLIACGIKAMPRPPLTAALAESDAGTPPLLFPDAGCFGCPAGAR